MRTSLLFALALSACAARYERIDHFTWGAPHTDVVWMRHGDKVARCHLAAKGPVCMEAKWIPAFTEAVEYDGGMPAAGFPSAKKGGAASP